MLGTPAGARVAKIGITSAVDHLAAMLALLDDARSGHGMAPASLARGALEGTAQTIWALELDVRSERLERMVRLISAHESDRRTYLRGVVGDAEAVAATNTHAATELADRIGLSHRRLRRRPRSTEMVAAAGHFMDGRDRDSMMLERWRAASAVAHGRVWPVQTFGGIGSSDAGRLTGQIGSDQLHLWVLTTHRAIHASTELFDRRRLPH